MAYREFQEFTINLDIRYEDCKFIIEMILKNFDSKIIKYIYGIDAIYCDFLIKEKFTVCFHYHDMVGSTIIALTKESEETAKKISNFINETLKTS